MTGIRYAKKYGFTYIMPKRYGKKEQKIALKRRCTWSFLRCSIFVIHFKYSPDAGRYKTITSNIYKTSAEDSKIIFKFSSQKVDFVH